MGDLMKASAFSLTEAKYAGGDGIKHIVFENAGKTTMKVKARQENIAGVKLPTFEPFVETGEVKNDLVGLARAGQQVQICRTAFMKVVEVLVELASLQTSFITLDKAIKTTNRRVNALENVVKQKLENTISYIRAELDELEREEFFRLKKVQACKKKEVKKRLEKNKKFLKEQMAASQASDTQSSLGPDQAINHMHPSTSVAKSLDSLSPRSSMQSPRTSYLVPSSPSAPPVPTSPPPAPPVCTIPPPAPPVSTIATPSTPSRSSPLAPPSAPSTNLTPSA